MLYFDAKRPLRGGRPCYLDPEGRPIAALPGLHMFPLPDGRYLVRVFLLVNSTTASPFQTRIDDPTLELMLYTKDPEAYLESRFKYRGPSHQPPSVTLKDLGLE